MQNAERGAAAATANFIMNHEARLIKGGLGQVRPYDTLVQRTIHCRSLFTHAKHINDKLKDYLGI